MNFAKNISLPFARFALFVIYFWFGLLKVIGESPASSMVLKLFSNTIGLMHTMSPEIFIICFGIFEMLIGLLFLIPQYTTLAIVFFVLHILTTTLPLLFLPDMVWTNMFVPTLEGQYIVKNLALIACVIFIYGNTPVKNNVTI